MFHIVAHIFVFNGKRLVKSVRTLIRANQFFMMGRLLGWQLYCHPQKTRAIQGWQYNCHPNIAEN